MLEGKGRLRAKLIFVNSLRTDLDYIYVGRLHFATAAAKGKK
jgi:hypothetical protein